MEAVAGLNELNKEELHNIERPISYIAYQNAEINRDSKKRRKPYSPDDFYFYANEELLNLPDAKYGAAAMALIRLEQFPSWALFAYKDLKARAEDALAPELLCLQCEDAIILAPDIEGSIITGMLIASRTASNNVRILRSPCGKEITARMPTIEGKFEANEEAEIRRLA